MRPFNWTATVSFHFERPASLAHFLISRFGKAVICTAPADVPMGCMPIKGSLQHE